MGPLDVFSAGEKRNMARYIGGIMLYKFALETLNGCMSSIVLKRTNPELGPNKMWTIMLSINYACQCLGSLLVSPLVKRFDTSVVLSRSIIAFALIVLVVPIMELVTGGGRQSGLGNEKNYSPGNWNPMILFAIYPVTGIFYGMVELIRRMIPTEIVGSDEIKLKKIDSLVHIFYEVAGTAGALLSSYWIAYFNYGYSLAIIPVMFSLSALVWTKITLGKGGDGGDRPAAAPEAPAKRRLPIMAELKEIVSAFLLSVYLGAKLVLGRRSLVWLVFAYSLPLVLHRYLENVVFAQYAAQGLGVPSSQQKLVAGSNLGELAGALFVFLFSRAVATPLPWLRLDAITLAVVWIFPLVDPLGLGIGLDAWVWCLFPIMLVVSFGWAAGDCSLVAFVQSHLAGEADGDERASALGSVMAFLYILYIVLFAVVAPLMGSVLDSFLAPLTRQFGNSAPPVEVRLPVVRQAMIYTAGVFMTCCGLVILASTFVPRGALAFNPKIIGGPRSDAERGLGEVSDEKREDGPTSPTKEAEPRTPLNEVPEEKREDGPTSPTKEAEPRTPLNEVSDEKREDGPTSPTKEAEPRTPLNEVPEENREDGPTNRTKEAEARS